MADSSAVEPLPSRRERQPERGVLAVPPAGADAEEGASPGDGVERRDGLGRRCRAIGTSPGTRACPGAARCPSPASMPSVTHGSGIGSHARSHLRDLDQVIHQRHAGEPRRPRRRSATYPSAKRAGSSPHGKREICNTNSRPDDCGTGAQCGRQWRSPPARTADDALTTSSTLVPTLGVESRHAPARPRRSCSTQDVRSRAPDGRGRNCVAASQRRRRIEEPHSDNRQCMPAVLPRRDSRGGALGIEARACRRRR